MTILSSGSSLISKSPLLASAPEPQRLRPGETMPTYGREKAIQRRAMELVLEGARLQKDWQYGWETLKQEFDIDLDINAQDQIRYAFYKYDTEQRAKAGNPINGSGGAGFAAPIPLFKGYKTLDEAKAFAQKQLIDLKDGLRRYNLSVRTWSPEDARKRREDIWTIRYQSEMARSNNEQAAIKFADDGVAAMIAYEGNMNDMPLRVALAAFQTGFKLSGPLTRENPDGTWSLNTTTVHDLDGNLVMEIQGDGLSQRETNKAE